MKNFRENMSEITKKGIMHRHTHATNLLYFYEICSKRPSSPVSILNAIVFITVLSTFPPLG